MQPSTKYLFGDMRHEELEAHRADIDQKASLLASMPSPKEIEENWPLFLQWQNHNGFVESPPSLSQVFEEGGEEEMHLCEFFHFWTSVQRYYLAALTSHQGLTMEGVLSGCSRSMNRK